MDMTQYMGGSKYLTKNDVDQAAGTKLRNRTNIAAQ